MFGFFLFLYLMMHSGEHTESVRITEIYYPLVQFVPQKKHSDAIHREHFEQAQLRLVHTRYVIYINTLSFYIGLLLLLPIRF